MFFCKSISDAFRSVVRIHDYTCDSLWSSKIDIKIQQRIFPKWFWFESLLFENLMWLSNWILFLFFWFFTSFVTLFLLINSRSRSLSLTAKITCALSHWLFPIFKLFMFRDVVLRFFLFNFSQSFKKLLLVKFRWFVIYKRFKRAFMIKFNRFLLLFDFNPSFVLFTLFKKFLNSFWRIIVCCWVVNLRFEWILDLFFNFWFDKVILIRNRRPLIQIKQVNRIWFIIDIYFKIFCDDLKPLGFIIHVLFEEIVVWTKGLPILHLHAL